MIKRPFLRSSLQLNIAVLSLGLVLENPVALFDGWVDVDIQANSSVIAMSVGDDLTINRELPLVVEKRIQDKSQGVIVGEAKQGAVMESRVEGQEVAEETEEDLVVVPTATPEPQPREETVKPEPMVAEIPEVPEEETVEEVVSTPVPSPRPVVVAPEELEGIFNTHAEAFGVDVDQLKSIARCESRFNPAAVGGIYGGLFQFSASTWASTRRAMGLDENPELRFDANEAVMTAAFKIASGGINAWKGCLR